MVEVLPGISMNPDVRFGQPCITGTRIDVATIVGLLGAGETVETRQSIPALARTGSDRARVCRSRRRASPAGRAPGVVKVVLDENCPLGLVPGLIANGYQVDHVISIGWRGGQHRAAYREAGAQ